MVDVGLALGLHLDAVARRDDLGVHHARLGAAQAGVGPFHSLDAHDLYLVGLDVQLLSQVLLDGAHNLLGFLGHDRRPLNGGAGQRRTPRCRGAAGSQEQAGDSQQ